MEYADLRVLEAVARCGSMNRAAAALNTVQSNVTARIRALEAEIGTALFERTHRGVVLTAAGQRHRPYAAQLGALLKEAGDAARDDGTPRGSLCLGALETTAALRLPPILSAYAQAYPGVGLTIITGTSASLVADVLEYRMDGALVAGLIAHSDLAEEAVFREELMLVTAPALRGLDDLARQHNLRIIVFRRGCAYRRHLEDLLDRRGIQTAQPLEFGSLDAILGCVAAGLGVTLLPKAYAECALNAAGLVPRMLFLVDFVARGLGQGLDRGAQYWVLFGLGAVVGPVLSGRLADRTGFGPALRLALLMQAAAVALPAAGLGLPGLIVSSVIVGAFTPGIVPLVLGRVHELLPHDTAAQQATWSRATIGFALMQAVAAYGLTFVLTRSGGDYRLLFMIGAGVLIAALAIDLAAGIFPSQRSAQ
jgi:DNA-binding transcriptional LysR family regulator